MTKSDYCVFIGRFQPFHLNHQAIAYQALEEAEKVVIVVGSYRVSKSIRNPWSFEFRRDLILKAIPKCLHDRFIIVSARDYLYSDDTWLLSIQQTMNQVIPFGSSVKLIGAFKDDTSYYLKKFPQWEFVEMPIGRGADGTQIRKWMSESDPIWKEHVSEYIIGTLIKFAKTDDFKWFRSEYDFINNYIDKWKGSPYPPTFVTTDAVVVKAGHLLVVERKFSPGKGMLAVPGGFVGSNEKIFDACIRELGEETHLKGRHYLKPDDSHVFDHPRRSSRGRTISHAFFFRLEADGKLPEVFGGDDASRAFWLPFADITLNEQNFFEDHLHISNHFIQR